MLLDYTVAKSIVINTSIETVWQVLTQPEIIKEWLYGTETLTDWQVGSAIIFQGVYMEQAYQDKGRVLSNITNQELSYSYWSGFSGLEDLPENYATVTYSIEPLGENKCNFTWTQQGFSSEDAYNHSLNGMDAMLEEIKKNAERI